MCRRRQLQTFCFALSLVWATCWMDQLLTVSGKYFLRLSNCHTLTWFWICLQFIETWHLNCCWGKPLSVCQPSCELNVRRINCLEVSPTWGDGGSWRVNHFYRREIIYDFHKGESVWFLSHFRIKFIFFANHVLPVLACDDSELQTMETMHTYTPVFTVKLLSGECSQEEVHKLTLNLCQHAVQTNHLAKRLWRTNQHKLSGRRYLDLKDWTHRVRSGDCGNRLARCIDLPGKASQCVTHSKTKTITHD